MDFDECLDRPESDRISALASVVDGFLSSLCNEDTLSWRVLLVLVLATGGQEAGSSSRLPGNSQSSGTEPKPGTRLTVRVGEGSRRPGRDAAR